MSGGHHCQGRGGDRATHAEAQDIDLLLTADILHCFNAMNSGTDVIIPSGISHAWIWIFPRDQVNGMALFNQIANHGTLRLQIQNVIFVDARRNHQVRTLKYLFSQWLELQNLEQLGLINNGALSGCDVLTYFKS